MTARIINVTVQIDEANRKLKRLEASFNKLKDKASPVFKNLNDQIEKLHQFYVITTFSGNYK